MVSPLVALVALLAAAPLMPGVITRTKAVLTGRRGAPVWQLYADLWKLARRGVVYSDSTTWTFRLAPVVMLATAAAAATLLPLDGRAALLTFAGDAVAFVALLALGRFVLLLAAFDTGSSFEGMGASRDAAFATLLEPGILVAFTVLGIAAGAFSLSAMLGATGLVTAPLALPPLVMVAVSLFALALAECARVPVDDPATHLELTMVHEVMVLDHSGPDLALILYAGALKLALFAAIIANVLVPGSRPGGVVGVAVLLISLVAMGVAIGLVESMTARLRLPRVPLYIAGASALALFGLILVIR
jgi:formate hydrogenlyase subunit 4